MSREIEVWKDIKEHPGFFQVSNRKRVRVHAFVIFKSDGTTKIRRSKILKKRKDNLGREYYSLTIPAKEHHRFYIEREYPYYFTSEQKNESEDMVIKNINQFGNSQFIGSYNTIQEASEKSGVDIDLITVSLDRSIRAGGFYWKTKSNLFNN